MISKIIFFVLLALLLNAQIVYAAENEYGTVNAWFNDKNATVEGFNMKIGEPGEIKIEVVSNIDGDVIIQIYEPGVTRAFKVINGPSEIEKRIDNLNIKSGWSKTYIWTVAPNGDWKDGNAPINVFVQFYKGMKDKKIDFTIANPYILDEQYSGAAPVQTTGAIEPAPDTTQKEAPFISALGALTLMLAVWMWMRRR